MKIYLDRSLCNDSLPTCERRMARLIRFPLGEDRPCITAIEEDGQPAHLSGPAKEGDLHVHADGLPL